MKKIALLSLIAGTILLGDTVHSSVSTYYEFMSFSNSVQKEDARVYGVGADIHYGDSAYKVTYEHAETNTKQPPLSKDLHIDKLFLKYSYRINNEFMVNLNYLDVMHDNIAITDDGRAYGLGLTYNVNKKLSANFTHYYTSYDDFRVNQSDLKIDYKYSINDLKMKFNSITKYIDIDDKNINGFTKNAKSNYLTSGIKLHSHYESYHFGMGAYFGKRAFAIMNNGFKIQHHAMEFDRTYAIGTGKTINDFVFRFQYVYQRATELPALNENVTVRNLRLIANYKF